MNCDVYADDWSKKLDDMYLHRKLWLSLLIGNFGARFRDIILRISYKLSYECERELAATLHRSSNFMTQPRVFPTLPVFLPVIPTGKSGILDTTMATTPEYHEATNGTVEKWSGTFQWEKRDSRLDNFPMMSTLWPTIGVTVLYALGAGILLRGRLTCCITS